MPLGRTLKALRQKQSLNQKALSALSGVSQATISRIETGRVRQLRSSALKNLADALGVSVDFLMGDHEVFAALPAGPNPGTAAVPGVREDRFRQIADGLDAFVIHEQGRILYVNQSCADLVGYRREELLGKNGIELVFAAQSRPLAQRMVSTLAPEPYEALLVRRDGSVVPVEIAGRTINDNARLAVIRNVTERRIHQTCTHAQQAALEVEEIAELGRVVRVVADEFEEMGVPFDGFGVNVIAEDSDRLTCFLALPEARGYRLFHDQFALHAMVEQHAAVRGLVSHWRRGKLWDREADAEYLAAMGQGSAAGCFTPAVVIDVPFAHGTVFIGLPSTPVARTDNIVAALTGVSLALAGALKRLNAVASLRTELAERRREPQTVPA